MAENTRPSRPALAGIGIAAALVLVASGLILWLTPRFDPQKYGTVDFDVPYCSLSAPLPGQADALTMDLYYPDSGGPWPVLVFVHGGGWTEGDKGGLNIDLAAPGYLLVSINYRLYPAYRFPAMIEDVKCAIRSLRAHAREYNLDPGHIVLVGHSAGGHLAALAATADETAGWDRGEYLRYSSRVQAAVILAGPADLTRAFPAWVEELVLNVFGAQQRSSASPVTHVTPDDPPFLILHGDADPVVPVEQAYLLRDALSAAQVRVELYVLQNAGHGFEPAGGTISPPIETVYPKILEFLEDIRRTPPRGQ